MKTRILTLLLPCLLSLSPVAHAAETGGETVALTLPQLKWVLEIGAPGFVLREKEVTKSKESARFFADNDKTGVIMSAFLEKADHPGDAKECRAFYVARGESNPVKQEDISLSESGGMALREYSHKRIKGVLCNQKNFNAYLSRDGYWVDIHLSKVEFKPVEEKLFKEILENVKFRPKSSLSDRPSPRHYGLPEHGSITFDVPESWSDIILPPGKLPNPTIVFAPKSGNEFSILITPCWSVKNEAGFNRPEKLKPAVIQLSAKHIASSVEQKLTLKEFRNPSTAGYYYSFTDKAPKPGEWAYATQGMFGIEDLFIYFTILTNTEDSTDETAAFTMLHTMRRHKVPEAAAVKRPMQCWKCKKTFEAEDQAPGGECPHCGAAWKAVGEDSTNNEIAKKCHSSMTNFHFGVTLAMAAGYEYKERVNSYDLYKFSLDGCDFIVKKVTDGLEIHLSGQDIKKCEGLLDILIKSAEQRE